ncbi:DNA-3-methyladenine glycosylase [Aliibacillus thermotolerans]|uniref:Putative 3-methyladenine DNA glycosylase n=1 Tax=Aliibacillus thermotolerans TaxID=1834418 RepID=A0ABW0UCF8_9BACI|nr:DNA-3-methyladenine glycosylase [Aliibacillus thermotolerans]MDA3130220.1 DNA-3-methyladenine glycosylase [Aliibacillus thermotolerans]
MQLEPVHQDFFNEPTLSFAKKLLGNILVKETPEGIAAGKIVETEAYCGENDRAAHSFGNRRTKRTEIMFGPPGYAYVYVMHTHALINIVTEAEGIPHAVLIRAVEPVIGEELMFARRGKDKKHTDLTSGPGKLTKALGITKADYGRPMFEKPLYIAKGKPVTEISSGPRIGIPNTGEAKDYPWRFWKTGNKYVSR